MSQPVATLSRRKIGIAARFSLFVAAIIAVVWGQGLALLLVTQRDAEVSAAEQAARGLAGYAVSRAAPAIAAGDPNALEAALRPLFEAEAVREVAVTDSAGRPIWRSIRPGAAPADRADVLVSVPAGAGQLHLSLQSRPAAAPGFAAVLSLFVLTLLIAIPIAIAFARRVTEPLRRLIAFVETDAARTAGARIAINTGDEIERLALGFNQLLDRLEASMRRVRRLAFVDPETSMPNQEWFLRQIRQRVAVMTSEPAGPNGPPQAAIVLLRMNRLAQVAESLGQEAAQELLTLGGQRLTDAVRTAERIIRREAAAENPSLSARVGSAEFGVLASHIEDAAEAGRFAQMIASALAQPIEWRGQRLSVDCAFGVAVLGRDTLDADSALRQARLALRAAREDGRPIKFFTRALDRDANQRLVLEREMREGVERDQFHAYFQPKVCLSSGRVIGAEALARWIRPDQSIVSPGVFIPAAEENGLIGKIADAILRDACAKAARWAKDGRPLKVAVNVSALQFADDRFGPRVLAALDHAGLPADLLELEITESVAMTNVDRVLHLIEPLRARNVSFAIDDFGTGHSSLASLTRLPFDVLKIDQSFVRGLAQDKNAGVIIETILAMAASLDFRTVAEGVETEEEAAFLRLRGCEIAQGYLFGAPVAAADFLDAVRPRPALRGRFAAA